VTALSVVVADVGDLPGPADPVMHDRTRFRPRDRSRARVSRVANYCPWYQILGVEPETKSIIYWRPYSYRVLSPAIWIQPRHYTCAWEKVLSGDRRLEFELGQQSRVTEDWPRAATSSASC
jgi:hypothetical protein